MRYVKVEIFRVTPFTLDMRVIRALHYARSASQDKVTYAGERNFACWSQDIRKKRNLSKVNEILKEHNIIVVLHDSFNAKILDFSLVELPHCQSGSVCRNRKEIIDKPAYQIFCELSSHLLDAIKAILHFSKCSER